MQQELANKISARIGIPLSDFESVLPKLSEAQRLPTCRIFGHDGCPPHDIAMLCLLAFAMDRRAIFFTRKGGGRFLNSLQNDILVAHAVGKASCDRTIPHRSTRSWPHFLQSRNGLFHHGCCKRLPAATETSSREMVAEGFARGVVRRRLETAKAPEWKILRA